MSQAQIQQIADYTKPDLAIASLLLFLEHQTETMKALEVKVDCLERVIADHLKTQPDCDPLPPKKSILE